MNQSNIVKLNKVMLRGSISKANDAKDYTLSNLEKRMKQAKYNLKYLVPTFKINKSNLTPGSRTSVKTQ
jgi:hypothetical protein